MALPPVRGSSGPPLSGAVTVMPYERVWVIGGPASGKTTFAERYAQVTGCACIVLDEHYWLDDGVPVSAEKLRLVLDELLGTDRWIVDGQYPQALAEFVDRADCLVWLEPPFSVCYGRLASRTMRRLISREPMWTTGNNRESVRSVFGPRSVLLCAIRTRRASQARAEEAAEVMATNGKPVFRVRDTDVAGAATRLALGVLRGS